MKISTFFTIFLLLFAIHINAQETSFRINAGGTEVEYNGETFIADTYSNTGNTLDRPQTGLPEPYQTFRFSRSQEMSYDIPLEDGEYTVNLYFAELWFGATGGGSGGAGSRVFDVSIEGQLAEDNLDVFAEVGADAMLMKSHTVTVSGGILNIDFDSRDAVGGERHPIINAIEIIGEQISQDIAIEGFDLWRAPPSGDSGPGPIGDLNDGGRVRNFENNWSFEGAGAEITDGVKSVLYEYTDPTGTTRNEVHNTSDNGYISPLYTGREIGVYTITATPYSEFNQGGDTGTSVTISFEIIDSCEVVYFEVVNATTCNPNGGYAILRDEANNYDPEYDYTFSGGWNNLGFVYDTELNAYKTKNLYAGTYTLYYYEDHGCGLKTFTIGTDNCEEPNDFALRINTGGTEVEYNGETFLADSYSNTGSVLDRPQTGLPEPYQSFRYSRSQEMSYDIPLVDGEYTVNLYFAELWFGATGGGSGGVGSRVFDINIEGQLAEDNLDVFAEVGADAMLMKSHTVTVTGGVLNIDFDSRDAVGGERHPIINAIEILGQNAEPEQRPFIFSHAYDSNGTDLYTFTIPIDTQYNYNYNIDWGDGSIDENQTGEATHTYDAPYARYTVKISGEFPRPVLSYKLGFCEYTDLVILQWGDQKWQNLESAFEYTRIRLDATDIPNLSECSSIKSMFNNSGMTGTGMAFIPQWDISGFTDLSGLFTGTYFNEDISNWDVSNVTNMSYLFSPGHWGCGDSSAIFETIFNQDISSWDVSNVENMEGMFDGSKFNQDISSWKISNVTNMSMMFQNSEFNQDISNWDVSNVTDMSNMFNGDPHRGGASNPNLEAKFNQDISSWNVINVQNMEGMFDNNEAFSDENYEKALTSWSELPTLQNGVGLDANDNQYCAAEAARQKLIDVFGWEITDEGLAEACTDTTSFITTWKTDNQGFSEDNQITIPTVDGETYYYSVDWGDGNTDENVTGKITHTYANAGTYTVSIAGDFPRLQFFPNSGQETDYGKILTVNQWGDLEWNSMFSAFMGCTNLDVVATDVPNLSNVQSMSYMFSACYDLVGNSVFNDWNVSAVTDMSRLFYGAESFNQDISGWNVSKVATMEDMFSTAQAFNRDLSTWNVSNVTDMSGMFRGAISFNQDISSWDVSNVTNMFGMFYAAEAFNQNIASWNVVKVTDMRWMFRDSKVFNQDLGDWNVSNVQQYKMHDIFTNSGLSNQNYDKTLIGWSQLPSLQNGVELDAPQNQYCASETARQSLIDNYGWVINDAGKSDDCFETSDFSLRINTGGTEVEYNGETFIADTYSNTGNTLDRPQTGLPEPYQTFRFSRSQEMSYDIPLEDGEYTVNLYFAELWFGATGGGSGGAGSRVFDVSIEGQLAEDNLDVFAEVGADAMLMKSHTVTVSGGILNIDFDSRDVVDGERHPVINAIEIMSIDDTNSVTSKSGITATTPNLNDAILSPNPVVESTTLSFEKPVQLSDVQVFDVSGRLVRTFKATEVSADGAYKLKVHGLESGTYFINAIDKQGVKHQKQMVIQQ